MSLVCSKARQFDGTCCGTLIKLLLVQLFSLPLSAEQVPTYKSLEAKANALLRQLNEHEVRMARLMLSNEFSHPFPVRFPSSSKSSPFSHEDSRLPLPRPSVEISPAQSKPDTTERPQTKSSFSIVPKQPFRSEGYYLGFVVATLISQSGGIRREAGAGTQSEELSFENGHMVGLLLGKDFGFVRVEAEHAILHSDGENGNGFSEIHPTTMRAILDRELTERLDFRLGIGFGVDRAKVNYDSKDYKGISFCYDFLVGLGIRLNERMGVNFDYRFFLTAATDEYKRLQNHLLAAQLQFDL